MRTENAVPSEADILLELIQASNGDVSTDIMIQTDEYQALLDQVVEDGRLTPEVANQALQLRQDLEDQDNIRESEGEEPEKEPKTE